MKKLFSRLFIISLASVALSGCDFFSSVENEVEADGIELKNYKTAVVQNTEYEFTGKAYLKFSDAEGKTTLERDVTDKCIYPTLDTSKAIGSLVEYKVSYETTKFIYSKTVFIKIVEAIELDSLEIKDYSTTVKAKETYTFDGKAIAKYNDSTEKDVTDKIVTNNIDTSKAGNKDLVVSYTEDKITKSVTKAIKVLKELKSITISGYKSGYQIGDEYSFDGKIIATYSDDSQSDVTNIATIDSSQIDTSKEGSYKLLASYTEDGITVETDVNITVSVKVPKLVKIEVSDYTNSVEKNKKYTFDGIVTAHYDDDSTVDVTHSEYCSIPELSTTSTGVQKLTIVFTDVNYGTSAKKVLEISVYSVVSNISVPTTLSVSIGKEKSLTYSVSPTDARDKTVTFASDNEAVATVSSSGSIKGIKEGTAHISVTSVDNPSAKATTTVTVSEKSTDEFTILIYICGANLESDYASSNQGLATSDIKEILSVANQPDDVNIVIETGGARSWSSTYGISSSKLERWHVENKALKKDQSLTYASMGLTSTLESFVEYGLKTYPAERTGLILWNHGGAMSGVCFDEKKSNDSLLTNEVASAVSEALVNTGNEGQKLEFIGYDACLMQVQDIASINSDYFNYMIASEESEAGEGWDYDTWVDDLYRKSATSTILKAVVDGFIKDNGGTSSSSNDQTLSYLDLSKMPEYITAWNNMATQLGKKLTSSNKSSFNTLVKSAKHYADSDYTYYGIFDAKDFINKLAANSTFNPGSTYTNAVISAFDELVEYSSCGKGAGNSNGLCLFWAVSSNCEKNKYYTENMTKLSDWRTLVSSYGY